MYCHSRHTRISSSTTSMLLMCMHSLMERKTEGETMYEHGTKRRRGTEIQELQFVEVGRILRLASLQMVKGFPSIKQRANS